MIGLVIFKLALAAAFFCSGLAFAQSIRIPGTEVDDTPPPQSAQIAATPTPAPEVKTKASPNKPAIIQTQPQTNAVKPGKRSKGMKTSDQAAAPKPTLAADSLPAIPLTPFIPANP